MNIYNFFNKLIMIANFVTAGVNLHNLYTSYYWALILLNLIVGVLLLNQINNGESK